MVGKTSRKTKMMSFKEHEIKRVKELRAKFGDLATEVCNEMLDDRVVPNIGDCESKGLRVHWMLYWENIKSILKQNK
jgi:hypothetical protein